MTLLKHALWMILLPLVVGCNNDNPPNDNIVAPQHEEQSINIGYLVGSVVHLRNSALLAKQQINDVGGVMDRPFNPIILQSENADVSAQKALELMDNYDINLIMVTTSSRTLAVAEQAVPREVVVLSETATSPLLTDAQDNDYLFRTAPSDIYQGRMLAELAWQEGASSASMIVNEQDPYGLGLAQQFDKVFKALGGQSLNVIEIPESDGFDFHQHITLAHANGPDTVILALINGPNNAQFVNESIGFGFAGFYLLPDVAVGSDFTQNLASIDLIQNGIGVSPSFGVQSNPEFAYFAQSYLQTYGLAHQRFDANVYDATMISALAIQHAATQNNTEQPSGMMIRQSMRAVMNPPGIEIGPTQIGHALELIRQGEDIDYIGAYSKIDFDQNGDLAGTLVYDIHRFDPERGILSVQQQLFIEVALTPD